MIEIELNSAENKNEWLQLRGRSGDKIHSWHIYHGILQVATGSSAVVGDLLSEIEEYLRENRREYPVDIPLTPTESPKELLRTIQKQYGIRQAPNLPVVV